MSVKRKRRTSALRTLYITNNPIHSVTLQGYQPTTWLTGNLTGFGDTFVVVNNKPLYKKLKSQRIIKTKKSKPESKCHCGECQSIREWSEKEPPVYIDLTYI